MLSIQNRDLVGGLLLLLTGALTAIYVFLTYDLGTFRRMGTGMFPFSIGVILAVIGAVIAFSALRKAGQAVGVALRPAFFILASVALFALVIDRFGAIIAIVLTVFTAACAEQKPRWISAARLSAGLILGVWLIFVVGLGSSIKMWGW